MIIKDITEEIKEKIIEETVKIFNTPYWTKILNTKAKDIDIEELNKNYNKAIWEVAEKTIEIKQQALTNKLKTKSKDHRIEEIEQQINITTKAILSIPIMLSNPINITTAIELWNNKIEEKYQPNTYLTKDNISEEKIIETRNVLQETLVKLKQELEDNKKKKTLKFIQERVNEIRGTRKTDPNKFFSKAQPDSVFRSQQLWAVEFEETKTMPDKTKEKIITTSSIPEVVAKQVKLAWETVFTSRTKQTSKYHKAFDTKKFKQIAQKITAKDTMLT
jgi:hypothetical protein